MAERPVWAVYAQRSADGPWRLEAFSVVSPERARGLAEREHARQCVVPAGYLVRRYADLRWVPWTLTDLAALAA